MWAAGQVIPTKQIIENTDYYKYGLFSFVGPKGEKFTRIFQVK